MGLNHDSLDKRIKELLEMKFKTENLCKNRNGLN